MGLYAGLNFGDESQLKCAVALEGKHGLGAQSAMGISLFATAHCSAPITAHGANLEFEPTDLR